MTRFLQSGRRRDICVLLADEPRQAQALKSSLESHYDVRIDPKSFYGALDALEDSGFVETETEGIHDSYMLTDAGERRLYDHLDWMQTHLDSDDEFTTE
jgi:DNA-binding PadR family transcriptional regulator